MLEMFLQRVVLLLPAIELPAAHEAFNIILARCRFVEESSSGQVCGRRCFVRPSRFGPFGWGSKGSFTRFKYRVLHIVVDEIDLEGRVARKIIVQSRPFRSHVCSGCC